MSLMTEDGLKHVDCNLLSVFQDLAETLPSEAAMYISSLKNVHAAKKANNQIKSMAPPGLTECTQVLANLGGVDATLMTVPVVQECCARIKNEWKVGLKQVLLETDMQVLQKFIGTYCGVPCLMGEAFPSTFGKPHDWIMSYEIDPER